MRMTCIRRARRRHLTIGFFGIVMLLLIAVRVFYLLLPLYAIGYMLGTSLLHAFVVEDEEEEYRRELEKAAKRDQKQKMELSESREVLKDALAAAENANKVKTSFLSNMSHEIRTPMNAIIGLNNIAMNDPTASDQCNDKGLAYDCHMKGQIDDYFIGDVMKLKQVMINILGNAVKFTPEGGEVRSLIEEVNRFDRNVVLKFIISDTGIGMSKEFLPNIFEPFSQEEASSAGGYGSTGLGMSITKSIVELMNGHIDVVSEKGKGTTFTIKTVRNRSGIRDPVAGSHRSDG